MVRADLLQGFYLGEFLVEPLKGQVTGRAGSQHLPPKAAEVLVCLAQHAGELVTRETLLDEVWGVGQGSQEALGHAVSEIRHVLNDDAANPTFIQTLPKRGYRLVVEPELLSAEDSVVLGRSGSLRAADIGLFENLKRRGVLETGIAYMIVGWLLIQVADIVFSQLHLPAWTGTFVTMLVIAGFPIAIVLSWFLEFRDGRAVVHQLSAADARRKRFGRTYMSIVGSLAIASLIVYAYDQTVGLPSQEPLPPPETSSAKLPPIVANSLAVLPFVNLDGSNETQIFADGLVDDVITQLSRVPGLRVASRGDSYTLQPNSASQEVRQRLRVEMYLEGSVEMNANEMRITVQLIDSADGFHMLSRRFDRPREDFFDIRDEITGLTVANVRIALPPDLQRSSLQVAENPALDTYVLYRKGIEASQRPTTIDTIASALGWLDAALYVDPEYAAAHAGKCTVYVRAFRQSHDDSYVSLAESACASALRLNPNLDVVHTALGDLHVSTGQYREAETAYQEALAINPSNAAALTGLGRAYQRLGQLEEAEASLRKAVGIHPGDAAAYNRLGGFLFQTGRFEEAATQYQYLVALEPQNMHALSNLASAYMLQGDFASAVPIFKKAIDIEPTESAYSNLGLLYFYLGNLQAAIDNHTKAIELQPNSYLARSGLGDALKAAQRGEEALREFEKAEVLANTALKVNPNDPLILMDLAWIKSSLGRPDEASPLVDKARSIVPTDPYVHYIDGLIRYQNGDPTGALSALVFAVENGYSAKLLAADPNLSGLRDNPGFTDILNAGE